MVRAHFVMCGLEDFDNSHPAENGWINPGAEEKDRVARGALGAEEGAAKAPFFSSQRPILSTLLHLTKPPRLALLSQ
jgi:hypothetical protein